MCATLRCAWRNMSCTVICDIRDSATRKGHTGEISNLFILQVMLMLIPSWMKSSMPTSTMIAEYFLAASVDIPAEIVQMSRLILRQNTCLMLTNKCLVKCVTIFAQAGVLIGCIWKSINDILTSHSQQNSYIWKCLVLINFDSFDSCLSKIDLISKICSFENVWEC